MHVLFQQTDFILLMHHAKFKLLGSTYYWRPRWKGCNHMVAIIRI